MQPVAGDTTTHCDPNVEVLLCRQIGTELLQLLNFVELNVTGLRKILKKFDKRVGVRLGGQYIASRSNHPYSQLQQVFRTIVRDFSCWYH